MRANEKKKLNSLIEAFGALCEVNESMPARQALTLLVTAKMEADGLEVDMQAVGKATRAPSAVVSRDLLGLGKRTRMGKPGLDLVESYEDYNDLRRKPYRMTKKGHTVIQKMLAKL